MPIQRTPWIDDDGSGTVGTPINNAEKTALYNQIDAVNEPPWIAIPHNAGNFGATGGQWTVPNSIVAYHVVGKLAHIMIRLDGTTIINVPESLNIVVPWTLAQYQVGPFYFYADPAFGWGMYDQPSADPYLRLYRDMFHTPWPAAAGVAIRAMFALNLA